MRENMAGKDIKTYAYVLRRTNYGEADRILNLITPSGKMTAIAKSVRKEKSKLAAIMGNIAKDNYNLNLEPGLTQVTIECPVFLSLGYKEADIISICSSIPLAHCIGEYLDIKESMIYRDIILKTLGQLTK